jgi:hypothetical protein
VTTFLLTWKQSGWPHEEILRMVAQRRAQGYVQERWRIAAHKMARAGDRVWIVWMLLQGWGLKVFLAPGESPGRRSLAPAPERPRFRIQCRHGGRPA